MPGYTPFELGAQIEFLRRGVWCPATVVWVHYNPNRRPGPGRVSYDVRFRAGYHPLRVQAKNVRVPQGGT